MDRVDKLIANLSVTGPSCWEIVTNYSRKDLAVAERQLVTRAVYLAEMAEYIKYRSRLDFSHSRSKACANAKAKQILAFLGYVPSNPSTPLPDREVAHREPTGEF